MFKCVKCGIEKPDCEFYKAKNKRGLTSKCKECIKRQVREYRKENIDKIREYDRNRPNHNERIIRNSEQVKEKRVIRDEKFLESERDRTRTYREKYKEKYKAHCALNNAIRDNKIIRPTICSCCGIECIPQGHHCSYLEEHWLDVIWLCDKCHKHVHKQLNKNCRQK